MKLCRSTIIDMELFHPEGKPESTKNSSDLFLLPILAQKSSSYLKGAFLDQKVDIFSPWPRIFENMSKLGLIPNLSKITHQNIENELHEVCELRWFIFVKMWSQMVFFCQLLNLLSRGCTTLPRFSEKRTLDASLAPRGYMKLCDYERGIKSPFFRKSR